MNEPTPQEAAAALSAVHEGRDRVISSAVGSRRVSTVGGLAVFLYCAANDLFPTAQPWLNLPVLAAALVLAFSLHTRAGSSLLGQPVTVSNRSLSLPLTRRLLRLAPLLGIWIAAGLVIPLLHAQHGTIYYGALAGLYIIFLGPRFQRWLLRQDKD